MLLVYQAQDAVCGGHTKYFLQINVYCTNIFRLFETRFSHQMLDIYENTFFLSLLLLIILQKPVHNILLTACFIACRYHCCILYMISSFSGRIMCFGVTLLQRSSYPPSKKASANVNTKRVSKSLSRHYIHHSKIQSLQVNITIKAYITISKVITIKQPISTCNRFYMIKK